MALLFFTARETLPFWLVLVAAAGLAGMLVAYWTVVHRINKVWVADADLGARGSAFFSFGETGDSGRQSADWTKLRDRWEYAHVARAAMASMSFIALLIAMALGSPSH